MDNIVHLKVNLDEFRWSLYGDSYLYEEVAAFSEDKLREILEDRINRYISREYCKALRLIEDMDKPIPYKEW